MQKAYISLSIDIFVNKIQFIVNITYFLFFFFICLINFIFGLFFCHGFDGLVPFPLIHILVFFGFVLLEYLIRAYIQIEIQTKKIHII
jgi:hypothetical protein